MNRPDRRQLRMACRLHDRYLHLHQLEHVPERPAVQWQLVLQAERQLQLAQRHQLTAMETQTRDRYLQQLDRLSFHCRDLVAIARQNHPSASVPTIRDLLAELQGLEQEFGEIQIDLQAHTISIQTLPIVLEGVELGPFEVRLDTASLGETVPYEVIALEPHPASTSSDTTHPHVNCRTLCEGEARDAIRSAREQGRLCDLFLLITRVLQTYNSNSAYVLLRDWEGAPCSDCGDLSDSDDLSNCCRCESGFCRHCIRYCGHCEEPLCSDCEQSCASCDEPSCSHCLVPCDACGEPTCRDCLEEDLCPGCHDSLQEEEDSNDQTDHPDQTIVAETSPPTPREADPQTHSEILTDCLGQTAVPA